MVTTWQRQFGVFFGGWVAVTVSAMFLLEQWSPLLLFILIYVGFLLAVEWSEPAPERPKWHRRLRWISLLGLIVFTNLLLGRIEQITGMQLI